MLNIPEGVALMKQKFVKRRLQLYDNDKKESEKKKKEGATAVSVFERRQQEARAEAAKAAPIGTSQLSSVPKEASPPRISTSVPWDGVESPTMLAR